MRVKETIQFVYTNSLAWYGARLALDLLKNYMVDYNMVGTVPRKVVSTTDQKALLVSILADRGFHKLFQVFDYAKLPYYASERGEQHPIIICGGASMYQPEPIAKLIDVACIGDGEEFLMGLNEALSHKTKQARLDAIAELPGAYLPNRRKITYDKSGYYVKDVTGEDKIIIPNITNIWSPPPSKARGTGLELEIARGCNMSCAFCAITWRQQFRERPQESTMEHVMEVKDEGRLDFYAPNTGGVSYYSDIHEYKRLGSRGEVTVADFLKLPDPTSETEYKGTTWTFGVEGITSRLRRITGKPISYDMLDQTFKKLRDGGCNRMQIYMIRNIPGETDQCWDEFFDWYKGAKEFLRANMMHTEFQFTPLTKQAHTPLQWFNHAYSDYGENAVKRLHKQEKDDWNEHKAKGETVSQVFITPSRRKASWLIDILTNCMGRNGDKFLWAQHKGMLNRLASDKYVGSGYGKVVSVAKQCGVDVDAVLGDSDFDAVLPWSHIQPMGDDGAKRRLAFAKSIRRRIKSKKS